MSKSISKVLILALSGLLLVYSAARSWNFIARTVPAGQEWLGVFALAALDGGVVLWLAYYLTAARGKQRAVALTMVVVDFVALSLIFSLDSLLVAGENGATMTLTPEATRYGIVFLSVIIAANVGAAVMAHLLDPDTRRVMAQEAAGDAIEEAALSKIKEQADLLASELAPQLAADWMQRTRARHLSMLGTGTGPVIDARATDPKPKQRAPVVWMRPSKATINNNAETDLIDELDGRKNGGSGAHE